MGGLCSLESYRCNEDEDNLFYFQDEKVIFVAGLNAGGVKLAPTIGLTLAEYCFSGNLKQKEQVVITR